MVPLGGLTAKQCSAFHVHLIRERVLSTSNRGLFQWVCFLAAARLHSTRVAQGFCETVGELPSRGADKRCILELFRHPLRPHHYLRDSYQSAPLLRSLLVLDQRLGFDIHFAAWLRCKGETGGVSGHPPSLPLFLSLSPVFPLPPPPLLLLLSLFLLWAGANIASLSCRSLRRYTTHRDMVWGQADLEKREVWRLCFFSSILPD